MMGDARARTAKDSFRVVPSKVRRFVAFVGAALPTRDLGPKHWNQYVRHLRQEMRDGELARITARVCYGRAREMVRWLQEQGVVAPFEELNVSSDKALPELRKPGK